ISREFGSGGHFIGEEVSKRLGIPFYDKNIIQQIAEKTGFSEDFVKEQSEYAPSKNMFAYAFVGRDHTGSSLSDQVYAAQTQVIRNLAEKGSCIIIGRCADYILKDRPDTYHIFVYGDEYEKISRTQQLFNLSEKDARAMNRDMDKKRRLHYEYYTDRKWGDPQNHCMCLNTSALDMERCIRYILDLFE
ncbi:MAG: cytidylate kinase-like family protein, partial [Lachnospiraceae bacterium]|nr:cytidylate kinase-like family protein [Lachnospiraceae bacterium]